MNISWIKSYIKHGFLVHPCCPPDHRCLSPGKIPFDPIDGKHMSGWQNHPQFSLEQWQDWIDYESSINIGVLCGDPSNLHLVDIDDDNSERKYYDLFGRDIRTWEFTTGKGRRILFRNRESGSWSGKIPSGNGSYLEILGNGRQSVVPPSLHPSGRRYEWISDLTPGTISPATFPDLGEVLGRGSSENDGITSELEDWTKVVSRDTPKGDRDNLLTKLAGHLISPAPLSRAEVKLWINLYNEVHCRPPLKAAQIEKIVNSIFRREESSDGKILEIMARFGYDKRKARMFYENMQRNG